MWVYTYDYIYIYIYVYTWYLYPRVLLKGNNLISLILEFYRILVKNYGMHYKAKISFIMYTGNH